MIRIQFRRLFAALFCCMFLSCCGCGKQEETTTASLTETAFVSGQTNVLVPEAPGTATAQADSLILDFSNADQGYFVGKLTAPDTQINLQVTGPDGVTYKYFLDNSDEPAVFPFTAGSGAYVILAFEHIGDDQYISLLSHSLSVELENEFLPFLYPNQYVNFSESSEAVALAAALSEEAETDLEALELIYTYVTEHITYDDEKAATVETGYLPDIDETLDTGTGICFDYAALTAAMLRSLSIPARLEIGYSSDVRHAWIDVYIESMGWVEQAIEFNGAEWKLMDPTFASAAGSSELIQDYIGDGSNYTLQYVR